MLKVKQKLKIDDQLLKIMINGFDVLSSNSNIFKC